MTIGRLRLRVEISEAGERNVSPTQDIRVWGRISAYLEWI